MHLHITAVGSIDTSGISMLEEVKKNSDSKGLKVKILLPFLFSNSLPRNSFS